MAQQIRFFRKNKADFEKSWVTSSATEGTDIISNILDRSNRTAWGTSGSVDANNTQFTVNMGDIVSIDTILLVKHNFKNFLIERWDDINLVWISLQSVANSTESTSIFSFATITTSQIRVTITGTQTANVDKILCQFIATQSLGQLQGWPIISNPLLARNLVENKMLSGKSFVLQNVGFYSATLEVENWNVAQDLALVETLYGMSEGFLYWPCGGDENQFSSIRQGYRREDLFLVRCNNEMKPEWYKGFYTSGMKVSIDLVEVIT